MTQETSSETTVSGEGQPDVSREGKTWKRIGLIFIGAAVAGPLIGLWIGKQLLAHSKRNQRRTPQEELEPQRIEIPIQLEAETPDIEPEATLTAEAEEREAPKDAPSKATAPATVYVASDDRDKYHVDGCRWAGQIKPENRIEFKSREEAEAQGYTPCGTCRP